MSGSMNTTEPDWKDQTKNPRDLGVQVVISVALGLSAFLAFCILRPKWTGLYAARKRQRDAASRLPELPDSMLGWIPVLFRIPEEEVLAAAGLDAFVFLSFFHYAIKFLSIVLFFSLVVILPVNYKFTGRTGYPYTAAYDGATLLPQVPASIFDQDEDKHKKPKADLRYLWMYLAFVYVFTILAIHLLVKQTNAIIKVRQEYLAKQTSVTDRTFRLSGIPLEYRTEVKIKDFVEKLEIGEVENIMLCRKWEKLDKLIAERTSVLRRLEEAWTVHLGFRRVERNSGSLPFVQPPPPGPAVSIDDESSHLLSSTSDDLQPHIAPYSRDRPTTRIWFGFLNLQSKKIDAIDYYEENLRKLDERIKLAREEEYEATPLAFVTMKSTAACQMAVQAILDPSPMRFIAQLAPPPADVVWQNTYLARSNRMFRSWSVMLLIGVLTILWAFIIAPFAGLLNLNTIRRVLPGLADALESHALARSLVQTSLPTLILSLLAVAVPYLYDWLSNLQGMTSQGDVELSLISKSFFFTFFNLFIIFTVFGTASNFLGFIDNLKEALRDTTMVAYALAKSLETLAPFYVNLIVLQGLGLFPFRLLEFGSVALYPIFLIGAKTPRDYAELVQPPIFSYGYYLPQTLLIFVVCVVYSVLPSSWMVVLFGLIYFCVGSFIYKYQLLYAMDHRQHSTGRAWPMICNRVFLGLVVFQVAMIGILSLKTAFTRGVLIVPLLAGTIWFLIFFQRTYEPLMKHIALKSLDRDGLSPATTLPESRWDHDTDRGHAVDTNSETGVRYVNPSLVAPLEELWVIKDGANGSAAHA